MARLVNCARFLSGSLLLLAAVFPALLHGQTTETRETGRDPQVSAGGDTVLGLRAVDVDEAEKATRRVDLRRVLVKRVVSADEILVCDPGAAADDPGMRVNGKPHIAVTEGEDVRVDGILAYSPTHAYYVHSATITPFRAPPRKDRTLVFVIIGVLGAMAASVLLLLLRRGPVAGPPPGAGMTLDLPETGTRKSVPGVGPEDKTTRRVAGRLESLDPELWRGSIRVTRGPGQFGAITRRLGRSDDNDVIIAHDSVGRHQCVIDVDENDAWTLRNLRPTNATIVDGRMLNEDEAAVLSDGVEVHFGDVRFKFHGR